MLFWFVLPTDTRKSTYESNCIMFNGGATTLMLTGRHRGLPAMFKTTRKYDSLKRHEKAMMMRTDRFGGGVGPRGRRDGAVRRNWARLHLGSRLENGDKHKRHDNDGRGRVALPRVRLGPPPARRRPDPLGVRETRSSTLRAKRTRKSVPLEKGIMRERGQRRGERIRTRDQKRKRSQWPPMPYHPATQMCFKW